MARSAGVSERPATRDRDWETAAQSCARSPIAFRTGLIVTLAGSARDGGRPLDQCARIQAARSNTSRNDGLPTSGIDRGPNQQTEGVTSATGR